MGWGKALSAVIVMSISVMLVFSVLPVGAAGNGNGNSPLMFKEDGCTLDSTAKCAVYIDSNRNYVCEPGVDKLIMLPPKAAMRLASCGW